MSIRTIFQFYFTLVLLAPSFCGEDYFSVIRDLSDCTDHPEETIKKTTNQRSHSRNLRDHRVQYKNNRYRISESKTRHTSARSSQNWLQIKLQIFLISILKTKEQIDWKKQNHIGNYFLRLTHQFTCELYDHG